MSVLSDLRRAIDSELGEVDVGNLIPPGQFEPNDYLAGYRSALQFVRDDLIDFYAEREAVTGG